ncbi:MAG TPA: ATP-binding protein [Pseudonocardia sp.]|nr:ATP-binding protein [Pseudonocardia sp.]
MTVATPAARSDRDARLGTAARRARPLRRPDADPGARSWSISRIFAVGATLAGLVAVLAVVSGALALARLDTARTTLVERVGPALFTSQSLAAALMRQEAGVRGFAQTGRDASLASYEQGLAAQEQEVVTLQGLVSAAGLDGAAADLVAVERAAQAWRSEYAEPAIAAARAGGAPPAAEADARGQQLFEQVRTASERLVAGLDADRLEARDRLNEAARALRAVGVAIAAVLAGFLVVAAIGLRRSVLRPVSQLAGRVREVVSGDVQHKVEGSGPREIVELGEDVEAMRVHILRELDRLQETNRRLDEQAQELERSNRDLEQFAYVASHDLQEPLRKVSSFCSLLQRRYGGQLDDRADQYIDFAVDGAQRMQRLINDLLAFSRVGRTTERFEPVDLVATARAATAQLDTACEEADGEITIGELPTVPGDPVLLRQLLVNVIGNGLKFRRDGTPPRISITAAPVAEGWEIAVRDNGIGIEPEYADKVFVIFQRLHGRERYSGTGIGLALAKKIVEFHGGRIWIDTAPSPDPGTTVRFTLPAPADTRPDAAPDTGSAPPPIDTRSDAGMSDTGLRREPEPQERP